MTIDHTKVSTGTLTYSNMPVLISTAAVYLSTQTSYGHMSTAYDMMFSTMSDCSYKLFWDTETVNSDGLSQVNVWVNIPTISSSTDTTFYMCYGNSSATSYQSYSTATWDSGYIGVWHLGTVNGSISLNDSTSYRHNCTQNGSPSATTGQIDGAMLAVNPPTDWLNCGDLGFIPTTAESLEFWTLISSVGTSNYYGAQIRGNTAETQEFGYFPGGSSTQVTFGDGNAAVGWNALPDKTNFHHVVIVSSNIAAAGTAKLFMDGVDKGWVTTRTTDAWNQLGLAQAYGSSGAYGVNGKLDEVRVSSNTFRTSDWVKTEYNNQSSPSTFISIGAETTSGGGGGGVIYCGDPL